MADDFLTAITQRLRESGAKLKSGRGVDATLKGLVSEVKRTQDKIVNQDRPKSKPRTRQQQVGYKPTEFDEYDAARQKLIDFFSMNTPDIENKNDVITSAVNQVAREQRESNYKTPAATPAPKATQAAPPAQAAPSFDGEALRNILLSSEQVPSPETAPRSPSPQMREVGGDKRPPMELQMERQSAPEQETLPSDDITKAMGEPTGNALSYEPVEDERQPSAPIGNVSTEIGEAPEKPTVSEDRMMSLFKTSTGTRFNPKSKADAGRMAQLRSFVESNPDVLNKSDVGASLAFYRTLK